MPTFRVTIGRTAEEYTTIEVDAQTEDAASEHLLGRIKAGDEVLGDKPWEKILIHDLRVVFVEETLS